MTTYITLFNFDRRRHQGREGLAAPSSTPPRSYLPTWLQGAVMRTIARIRLMGKWRMTISVARHQFPPRFRHAVWLYLRFTLVIVTFEELLAERGLDVSYETVRRWIRVLGPVFARELRRRRPRPTSRWHLDEMAVIIGGRQFWLGARSTTKASSICSCNVGETRLQR